MGQRASAEQGEGGQPGERIWHNIGKENLLAKKCERNTKSRNHQSWKDGQRPDYIWHHRT